MDSTLIALGSAGLVVGLILGVALIVIYNKMLGDKRLAEAQKEVERIVNKGKSQAAKIERDSKKKSQDFEARARRNAEKEIRQQKQQLDQTEAKLQEKMKRLDKDHERKMQELEKETKEIKEQQNRLQIAERRTQDLEAQVEKQIQDLARKLEEAAQLTADQARKQLLSELEEEAKKQASDEIHRIEEEARSEAKKRSREILAVAISRYASDVSAERTVTTIPINGEEMKGKIIGREGRNIRALEATCGVDIVIDETPDSVIISSFDPLRREVAKEALSRLMEDGRVHPARIEEVVDKVKSELETRLQELGEKACLELGLPEMKPQVMRLIGSMKYRQAESQNLYQFALDVGMLCGLMAAEIGVDIKQARRAGLLHCIGRAIDHTAEASYAKAGAQFLKRHGEPDAIVHAVEVHNEKDEARTVLAHLVQAAIRLAISRPGARRQSMENYVKRLEDLESIGNSFDGVERTFAIQAGKEVRVIVDSSRVTDEQATMLSRDISRKISREMNYPGQIKVAVVRETRIVEHAR